MRLRMIAVLVTLYASGCTTVPDPVLGPPLEKADTDEVGFAAESVPAELEVIFFDVGLGDSTLIKCPDGSKILVDAGSMGGLSAAQKSVVREEIRDHIGDHLDLVVVTHPDTDHYNMIANVLQGVPVSHVFYGGERDDYNTGNFKNWLQAFDDSDRATSPPLRFHDPEAEPNPVLSCVGVDLWIMAANVPAASGAENNYVKNTPSIVLRISHGDVDIVLHQQQSQWRRAQFHRPVPSRSVRV